MAHIRWNHPELTHDLLRLRRRDKQVVPATRGGSWMIYPSELELLEFFGVEPERSDDVTLFSVADAVGVSLEFSYNHTEDSIQTALHVAGRCICLVCHEQMRRFWIGQGMLRAEFTQCDRAVTLSLVLYPTIRVDWSGLRLS